MRRLLLWMAQNQWLRTRVPQLGLAQRAVRRFLPGEDVEAALGAADTLGAEGIGAVFSRVGENINTAGEAADIVKHYSEVLEAIPTRSPGAEISVKPTQIGFDLDPDLALEHCRSLAETAAVGGGTLWIDMEGSDYVEGTVALYERLLRTHSNTGLCLQAYLHRTARDLQRLLPLRPSIRLVKGAYAEPATIAYVEKREVDANLVGLAVTMLEAQRTGGGLRMVLGTHDVELIAQISEHAAALGLDQAAIEVQMLYGIRMDQQRLLANRGYPVRTFISYGHAWYPWYMRRLAERPANLLFALRQLGPQRRSGG